MSQEKRIKEAGSLRSLFQQQWQHLLYLSHFLMGRDDENGISKQELENAVENIVDGTEGKLRIIANYKEQLRKYARLQLEYVDDVSSRLNQVLEFTPNGFQTSPLLQAVFNSPQQIGPFLAKERLLQEFIEQDIRGANGYLYGLLSLRKSVTPVFRSALRNDEVISDVKQLQLSFKGAHVLAVGSEQQGSESLLKQELHGEIVDYLKQELNPVLHTDKPELRDPNYYLEHLKSLMAHPEQALYYKEKQYVTNRFGIVADTNSEISVDVERHIEIKELYVKGEEPRILIPVAMPIQSLKSV